eukprot:scaffold78243_cov60-Phaeocystis_antarctica.AAC.1
MRSGADLGLRGASGEPAAAGRSLSRLAFDVRPWRGAHALLPVRPGGVLPRAGDMDLVEGIPDGRALIPACADLAR